LKTEPPPVRLDVFASHSFAVGASFLVRCLLFTLQLDVDNDGKDLESVSRFVKEFVERLLEIKSVKIHVVGKTGGVVQTLRETPRDFLALQHVRLDATSSSYVHPCNPFLLESWAVPLRCARV
jgi:hypothetical protein